MRNIFLVFAAVGLMSCGGGSVEVDPHAGHDHSTEEGHDHGAESADEHAGHDHGSEAVKEAGDGHAHEGGITLSEVQATSLGLTYEKVEPSQFSAAVRVSGVIEPSTADNSTIVAMVSGIVKINAIGLNIGSAVSIGSKLFTIESGNLADNNVGNRVSIAKSALEKAQSDFDRVLSLSKDNLATAAQVEEVKLALQTAKKSYESLSKAAVIGSPIGGYITSLDVKNGDYVAEGQPLATVSSGKSLVIKADLPSRYFGLLPKISEANIMTPYDGSVYTMRELNGRLLSKSNTVAQGSYSVPILFSVDNRAGLVSGSALEVFLITSKMDNVISVPTSSLTEEQGAFYVYIRTCVDSYEKVAVKVGDSNGERTEILSGLHAGDNVVTSGAYFVRLASASNSIPHGHSH